jgi:hypothetical protein
MLRCIGVVAAALVVSACGPRETGDRYDSPVAYKAPSLAHNFSARDYRSPGGVGQERNSPPVYRGSDVGALSVPYPSSCGQARTWDGQRCVRAFGGT